MKNAILDVLKNILKKNEGNTRPKLSKSKAFQITGDLYICYMIQKNKLQTNKDISMSKLQNFDIGIEPIFKINGIFILF